MPRRNLDWNKLVERAEAEIHFVSESLPRELTGEARAVPVVFEPVPSPALVNDGLEPDTLGLFVGISYSEKDSGVHDVPAQILLFLENIWLFARGDARIFRDEVRKTYIHELGHYLGLDEEDLWERGMD